MSIVFYALLSPRAQWVRLGLLERHNRHDRFLNSFHRCQTGSSCLLFPRDWDTGRVPLPCISSGAHACTRTDTWGKLFWQLGALDHH